MIQISVSEILNKLKYCGWYWGELSQSDAEAVLQKSEDGSFILRDSNDACHLFTISLKAKKMVISVRIAFSKGLFKLDASTQDLPSFLSVLDLVEYYTSDPSKDFYVQVNGYGEVRVGLRHPVIKEVFSLQQLCRVQIVRNWKTPEELESLPLPVHLKKYLLEFSHSPPLHFDSTLSS